MIRTKMFIQSCNQPRNPADANSYTLSVVCRGEENKDWSEATPSGTWEKVVHPGLDAIWEARKPGDSLECYVSILSDPDGSLALEECSFSYGGCRVTFAEKSAPWSKMSLNINARPATEALRRAYADSLMAGKASRFRFEVRPAEAA